MAPQPFPPPARPAPYPRELPLHRAELPVAPPPSRGPDLLRQALSSFPTAPLWPLVSFLSSSVLSTCAGCSCTGPASLRLLLSQHSSISSLEGVGFSLVWASPCYLCCPPGVCSIVAVAYLPHLHMDSYGFGGVFSEVRHRNLQHSDVALDGTNYIPKKLTVKRILDGLRVLNHVDGTATTPVAPYLSEASSSSLEASDGSSSISPAVLEAFEKKQEKWAANDSTTKMIIC